MKKILLFAATVLSSLTISAQTLSLSTLSADTLGKKGNGVTPTVMSGISCTSGDGGYYININSSANKCKEKGLSIATEEGTIDSVAILLSGASAKATEHIFVWTGWADTIVANAADHALTCSYTSPDDSNYKKFSMAVWKTYDFSTWNSSNVALYRALKNVSINGAAKATYGNEKSLRVWGIKVWVKPLATNVATLKDIKVGSSSIEGFAAATTSYDVELAFGTSEVPTVTATPTQKNETVVVTPAASLPGATTIEVTAADGTTKTTYTVNFTISTQVSHDATLKALKVDGTAISGFKADSIAYTYVIPYVQEELPVVTAEVNDETATAVVTNVTAVPGTATVVVTAQDGTTKKTYSVAISRAEALKGVKEIALSNGYFAWQAAGQTDIHAYYLEGESVPTIDSVKLLDNNTYAWESNTFTITNTLDNSTLDYPFTAEAVAPATFTADTITFDGSEAWVKSGYGWDSSKKWKFSKTDSDYSREWNGKTHIEMFLPACDSIALLESAGSARAFRAYANGVEIGNKYTQVANKWTVIPVKQNAAFMLTLKSAQTGGDGGFKAIVMFKKSSPATEIENVEETAKAIKRVINGQLVIEKNGVRYNALGAVIE